MLKVWKPMWKPMWKQVRVYKEITEKLQIVVFNNSINVINIENYVETYNNYSLQFV